MTGRLLLTMLCMLCLAMPPRAALAQSDGAASAADGNSAETQEIYRKALQSIAEGRKDDAMRLLEQVISKEARHAGAWLDMALIRCALGQREEAQRLFLHIERDFDPPPGILELIAEARAGGCNEWKAISQASVSVGRGMSRNVNQGTTANGSDLGLPVDLPVTDEFRPTHDQYNALTLDYMRELGANGSTGFVQFQGRRYDHMRDYDTASLFLGAETPWRWGSFTVRGNVLLGAVTLGGKLYQQQAQAQLRTHLPLTLPYGMRLQVSGSVNHIRYLTLQNFDANTADIRTQLSYRGDRSYATASVGYQYDHATADRPGGNRDGWVFGALGRYQLPRNLTGELGFNRQGWTNRTNYAPDLIDIVRQQRTHVWRAMLTYAVTREHSIVLEGRVIRNKENISLFQYNDRQLQLNWQWQGP